MNGRKNPADEAIGADLRALRAETTRDLPDLEDTARVARRPRSNRERIMKRPWLPTLVGAGALAVALVFVPVSYETTVGHDVTLTVRGAVDRTMMDAIATRMQKSLEGSGVRVQADPAGARLGVRSDIRSRGEVSRAVAALANELAAKGLGTETRIERAVERVNGNVWAYAGARILNIRVDRGGTPEQVESEIRRQLEDAGFANPDVSVTINGDQATIDIQGNLESEEGGENEIQLKVELMGDGDQQVNIQAPLDVQREPGMTDEQYRQAILDRLDEVGIEGAEVIIDGDEVRVEARKEECR